MADCCSSGRCSGHIPLEKIIAECDRLFNQEKTAELGEHLRFWRRRASELGDKKGELSMLSEMMGHYRMIRDEVRAVSAVRDGFALIFDLGIADTVSAGTIFINGATALLAFGAGKEAMKYYKLAEEAYSKHLSPDDVLFAGLYNNMASACIDEAEHDSAEKYLLRAAEILERNGKFMDLAVAFVNLAQLYDALDPEHPEIPACLDRAWECFEEKTLQRDGYYAHTCRKCAPAFAYFGRFMDEMELKQRSEVFYAGT